MYFAALRAAFSIRSGGVYGARRNFPKEVSSERKFSFLTDFLSVSRRLTRKSAARKMKSHFSVGGGFAEVPKKPPNRRLLITCVNPWDSDFSVGR